jgi:UDP-3-O-[3-hydroxymyristoyl] N-acetylglucosamine deacetylase
MQIDYDHHLFKDGKGVYEIDFSKQSYVDEISRARTFAFMYEIENIRKKIAVDTLLDEKLKINENYLMQLAQQELMLDKNNERNAIGFNKGI